MAQLRQNPAPMIREVRRGERYTLTDRSLPIAEIIPHREYWIPIEDVLTAGQRAYPDEGWLTELAEIRETEAIREPTPQTS